MDSTAFVSLSDTETAQLIAAIALLLAFAHIGGMLFARVRQPRVVGEIVGGLMLGPTVLGRLAPDVAAAVLPPDGPVAAAIGALYELGLLLLMFVAGIEVRAIFRRAERRMAVTLAGFGTVLPFVAALAAFPLFAGADLEGPAASRTALLLVFAAAVAVTSIPVISRIMLDLGLLNSSFARIVLGAAIIEDVALYAILAMAVGIAESGSSTLGLAHLVGIDPASSAGAAYYAATTSLVLWLSLILARVARGDGSRVARAFAGVRASVPWQLCLLLAIVGASLLLNVAPVFGALVAGIALAGGDERASEATETIKRFSLAVFIPLYFAVVGYRLDLVRDLDLAFFGAFLAFACAVKGGSVYLGARLAREPRAGATRYAMALNARGGPGIVLATVALDARIINDSFYVSLVLLAVTTSMLAGWWLQRALPGSEASAPGEPGAALAPARQPPA